MDHSISPRRPFGFSSSDEGVKNQTNKCNIPLISKASQRTYVSKDDARFKNIENIDRWKVAIPKGCWECRNDR